MPHSATNVWIDIFEEELSIAQTSGPEILLMGDFNIDMEARINNKALLLVFVTQFGNMLK